MLKFVFPHKTVLYIKSENQVYYDTYNDNIYNVTEIEDSFHGRCQKKSERKKTNCLFHDFEI